MKLLINGEKKEVNATNITELLKVENVANPDMVSVQLNGEFVRKENFENTTLNENDEVDFLYFMGGGAI